MCSGVPPGLPLPATHSDESDDHLQQNYYLFAANNRGDKHDTWFVQSAWLQLFQQGT